MADVQFGDTGDEVKEVQELLIAQNYLEGEADGDFGKVTEDAVKNFQRDNNLLVDGICCAETLRLLKTSAERQVARYERNPEESSNNLT